MKTQTRRMRRAYMTHPSTLIVAASLLVPTLSGCGSSNSAPPPPADASGGRMAPPPPAGGGQARQGMSTRNKVLILAGAAALYYMYKKKQNAQGQTVQYYKSESNGRIYYRDPQTKQAIYVTPPPQGIQVPAEEAQEYSNYKGYNRQNTGQDFGGWGASQPTY